MLKNQFSTGNCPGVHELEKELGNCTQQDATVVDYFVNLLPSGMNFPTMERIQTVVVADKPVQESLRVNAKKKKKGLHKFLLGLDNSVRAIISQILNMNPLLSVDNAYFMVIREERHCVITRDQDTRVQTVAFITTTTEKSSLLYTICYKQGHAASDCFQLVGYP